MAQADPVRLMVAVGFVGASMFAAYGGYRVLTAGRPAEPPPVQAQAAPGTPVLTAAAMIGRGEAVGAPQLRVITVQGPAPAGSFGQPEALVGKVATTDILPGQIVLAGMVSNDRADAGLSVLIEPGKRAIAIPIAEDNAVSNLLRAGDRVDVLLVLRAGVLPHPNAAALAPAPGVTAAQAAAMAAMAAPGSTDTGDPSETRTLLQDVPVLTVGDRIGTPRPPPEPSDPRAVTATRPEPGRTLTLSLTPEQAATVSLGRTLGTLELALRNPQDEDRSGVRPITLQELRGLAGGKPAAPVAMVDPRRPIELIVGGEHRVIYSLDGPAAPLVPAAASVPAPPAPPALPAAAPGRPLGTPGAQAR